MIDINKHRFYLVQVLKDIYADIEIGGLLGFKGGTALMFFYDLPRFSVDLDFNLLDASESEKVYKGLRKIVLKHGKIHDEAMKYYGPILVLDYGVNERKMKLEVSNRQFEDSYEIRNLLGINIRVMVASDMFAHKLCALLDREQVANRDIFDCWFFLQRQTAINKLLVEYRTNLQFSNYVQTCIDTLEKLSDRSLLQGIGELLDPKMKRFVLSGLRTDTIKLLSFYRDYPIFSK